MVYCYLKWTIWHLCVRIVNTKHEPFTIVRWKCFNKIGWKLQNFNLCFVNIDVVFSVWYDDTWIFLCKEMNLLIVSRVLDTSCGLYLLWLYAKYNEDNVNHIQLIFLGHDSSLVLVFTTFWCCWFGTQNIDKLVFLVDMMIFNS
jgi:hypothetical protein